MAWVRRDRLSCIARSEWALAILSVSKKFSSFLENYPDVMAIVWISVLVDAP